MNKKSICGLVMGLSMVGSQAFGAGLELPDKLKGYKDATNKSAQVINLSNGVYGCVHQYDVDGDMLVDVEEVYIVTGMARDGRVIHGPNPLYYSVDMNNDKKILEDEMYMDTKMDGLNGNEVKLQDYIKQRKQEKNKPKVKEYNI